MLRTLRISGLLETLEVRNRQAVEGRLAYGEFLVLLLQDEVERRAQAALNDSPEHALAGKLREQVQNMQRSLQKHEHEKLESLSLEAMRTLAQIESSGA